MREYEWVVKAVMYFADPNTGKAWEFVVDRLAEEGKENFIYGDESIILPDFPYSIFEIFGEMYYEMDPEEVKKVMEWAAKGEGPLYLKQVECEDGSVKVAVTDNPEDAYWTFHDIFLADNPEAFFKAYEEELRWSRKKDEEDERWAVGVGFNAISDRDNTYNWAWVGPTIDYGIIYLFENKGEACRDMYQPGIIAVREHLGGDVRGNYSNFRFFLLLPEVADFFYFVDPNCFIEVLKNGETIVTARAMATPEGYMEENPLDYLLTPDGRDVEEVAKENKDVARVVGVMQELDYREYFYEYAYQLARKLNHLDKEE